MKRLTLFIFVLFFFLPLPAGALDISSCITDTAECKCITSTYEGTSIDLDDEYAAKTCNDQCYAISRIRAYGKPDTWSIQCKVPNGFIAGGEQLVIVDSGDIEEPTEIDPSTSNTKGEQDESNLGAAPILGIEIPGLTFEDNDNGNYIGLYVKALYKWLLGASALLAVLMFMIAGLQWMMARGDASKISQAKDRMKNTTLGLAMLLGAYTIGFLIDPEIVQFSSLEIDRIEVDLYVETSGEEGVIGGADASSCIEAATNARNLGQCGLAEGFASPTDGTYSCNYHFRETNKDTGDVNYNYAKIRGLDYPQAWDSNIYAPISGTITYIEGTKSFAERNRCGNRIEITGQSGYKVTLCHVKDFLSDDIGTTIKNGTLVEQGQVIGHVGGACCASENPPNGWSQGANCKFSGTSCSDPFSNEPCQCQPYEQSGNTSGPHVHVTFSHKSELLTCIENYTE